MEFILYLLKGVLIGVILGAPIGVIGVLTIQRTLLYGKKAGLVSGCGSSVADMIYGAVGCFGSKMMADFINRNSGIITLIGASIVLFLGISITFKKAENIDQLEGSGSKIKIFTSSFLIGITNPVIVFTFMYAFSVLEIVKNIELLSGILVVIGVFLGTFIWWFILIGFTQVFKDKILKKGVSKMNKILGIIVILLGILLAVKSIDFILDVAHRCIHSFR